jgi:hypothetical protein
MPGLYGIITRAPGTLISGLIYNSDHQVHVDGRSAELMQAHATSLSQMNLQESPFGPDGMTETLPISLAGELTRLRYVISSVKQMLNGNIPILWWTPVPAPAFAAIGAKMVQATFQTVPTGVTTALTFAGATAEFNSGAWSVVNPTRFTAPLSGLYYVAASILWSNGVGGGRRQIQIGVNGVFDQAAKTATVPVNQRQAQTIAGLQKLTIGDYVEFGVSHNSGFVETVTTNGPQSITGGMIYFGKAA